MCTLVSFVERAADLLAPIDGVYATGRVIESGCNAHGRRKFRDAEATQPALAAEAGRFLGAMYGEEEKLARAPSRRRAPPASSAAHPSDRGRLRHVA
jgi:hypothetical protein